VLAAAAWPLQVLEVADLDEGRLLAALPAQSFQLRYRHSLYRGYVWEHFSVSGTHLTLEAVEAEREAAGEYYGLLHRVVRTDGRYRVSAATAPVEELVVRATALGERALLLGRFALPLYPDREGHRIRIRVVRGPVAQVALRLLAGHLGKRVRP